MQPTQPVTNQPPAQNLLDGALQRDIEHIRRSVLEIGALAEEALKTALRAMLEKNRQLAYSVILRDQRIDELEKEIDQLCLQFLVRQQPAAGHLRFAYAAIKINGEIERIGDYAESIARQALKLASVAELPATGKFVEIANYTIPMLHAAVEAFVREDAELARRTMVVEERVDELRSDLNRLLIALEKEGQIPLQVLIPLLTVARRFERATDQAKYICQETLYMCTGEYAKHRGPGEPLRVLFVDQQHGFASRMAECIGRGLGFPQLQFLSAGLEPKPADPVVMRWIESKGLKLESTAPLDVRNVTNLERVQVIVALDPASRVSFPPRSTKTVTLDWVVQEPATAGGPEIQAEAAYEQIYQNLRMHITDLGKALFGERSPDSL